MEDRQRRAVIPRHELSDCAVASQDFTSCKPLLHEYLRTGSIGYAAGSIRGPSRLAYGTRSKIGSDPQTNGAPIHESRGDQRTEVSPDPATIVCARASGTPLSNCRGHPPV